MLIDFTVENYRSIKDPMTLSAIAKPSRARGNSRQPWIMPDNEIAPPFVVEGRGFELLPVLGLFGANASGKSNIIRGLDDFLTFITHGDWSRQMHISDLTRHFTPFKLDYGSIHAPNRFRLRVGVKDALFDYTLSLDGTRVYQEKLEYSLRSSNRFRLLFERTWDDTLQETVWKNGVGFGGTLPQLQREFAENEPYLYLLVKTLKLDVVKSLADWLQTRWTGIGIGSEDRDLNTASIIVGKDKPEWLNRISEIVRRFDTGISRLQISRSSNPRDDRLGVLAVHNTSLGEIGLPLEEESVGTQRLYPLACQIVSAFENGSLLLIDELGSSIHPNITHEIVRLFQDPKTNPKRAQLIFTSHDNTLMQRNLLRRDQIWFTQKREDGSTELYPLTDFKPRNDLAIDRAYLDGRFEAVPFLPDTEDLLAELEPAA